MKTDPSFEIGTASYAYTASVAFTIISPPGNSIFHTQTVPSTNWEFTHSLGTYFPNYTVFDLNKNVILPARLTSNSPSSSTLNFAFPQAGTVVATVGGGLPSLSSSYAGYVLQVDQTGFQAQWRSTLLITGSQQYAETASYGENFEASGSFSSFGSTNLTGSVGITGSVDVTGSFEITGSTFITGTLDISGSVTLNGLPIGAPYTASFTNLSTWEVRHGLGRSVVVQTFNTDNTMFFPEEITLNIDTASVFIGSGIDKSGYVVVK
jgi:hypothetical protein